MSKLSDAIPNRVRALRHDRGWSLAELARRANTTAPTIMRLEQSTRQLSLDWIDRLAEAFEVEPQVLAFGSTGSSPVRTRTIPVIGTIAAGDWREAIETPVDMVTLPADIAGDSPNLFGLRPDGTSMNLIVPEGGYVLVDPDDGDLHEGKVYAVRNEEGGATVKRYRISPARLEPCSNDPSHEAIILGRQPFTVIGRVTGAYTRL